MINRHSLWVGAASVLLVAANLSCGSGTTGPSTPAVATVMLTPGAFELRVGQSRALAAVAKDANGATIGNVTITWASSNPGIASVNAVGTVSAAASGTDTITATVNGVSGKAVLTVTQVPVISVTVTPMATTVYVSQSRTFTATPRDSAGSAISGRGTVWASADTAVAKVSAAGHVTGIAPGVVQVTATVEGKSASAAITVAVVPVIHVSISPPTDSFLTGTTTQLTGTPKDSAGHALAGRAVAWLSQDTSKATVSTTGLVTAKDSGSVRIVATIDGIGDSATMTLFLAVDLQASCTPADVRVPRGTTVTLACSVTLPAGVNGNLTGSGHTLPAGVSIHPLPGSVTQASAGSSRTLFLAADVDSTAAPGSFDAPVLVTVAGAGQLIHMPFAVTISQAQVHAVYLIPSDRQYDSLVVWGIERALRHLQMFYQGQLGDSETFSLHDPVVTVLHSSHPSSDFAANAFNLPAAEVFAAFHSNYYDPHNIWVIYFDAVPTSSTSGGAASVATLTHGDVVGVSNEDLSGSTLGRWVGGLGHELGHAFGLPHPPGCDAGVYTNDCNSIMYWGYAVYPITFLPIADIIQLEDSTFVSKTVTTTSTFFDVNNFGAMALPSPVAWFGSAPAIPTRRIGLKIP
ncbi:MAG: Ig-like domain-containing protein [Gemmatimonadales bacterium]